MNETQSFGKLIKLARISLGKTQKAVAEECGVRQKYISKIEKGETGVVPSLKVLMKLVNTLQLDPNQTLRVAVSTKVPEEDLPFLNLDEPIKELMQDPSVKILLNVLSQAELPKEVIREFFKNWVEAFVNILMLLEDINGRQ